MIQLNPISWYYFVKGIFHTKKQTFEKILGWVFGKWISGKQDNSRNQSFYIYSQETSEHWKVFEPKLSGIKNNFFDSFWPNTLKAVTGNFVKHISVIWSYLSFLKINHWFFTGSSLAQLHWFSVIGFLTDWTSVTGFLDFFLSGSGLAILPCSVILHYTAFVGSAHSCNSRPLFCEHRTIKLSYSIGINITVIVVVFKDFASTESLESVQNFLPHSTTQSVPTQLNKPNCTLVELLVLQLCHTFCVILLNAPM